MIAKERKEREKKQWKDQLGAIFQVIGTPDENEELDSWLESEESRDYCRSFEKTEPVNLEKLYPGTEKQGLELIKKMLEFNPNKRITAAEALKDAYFDDIRLPEQESIKPPDNSAEEDLAFWSTEDDNEKQMTIEELKILAKKAVSELTFTDKFDFANDFEEE